MFSEPPFEPVEVTSSLLRFEGDAGWHHVLLPPELEAVLRPLVTRHWPALLKVAATSGHVTWTATVMPIKDGPLFIALPAKIRKRLGITEGDPITITIEALPVED